MNTNTQAKNGFKTFITTLGISLVVFSAIYYAANTLTEDVDEETTAFQVQEYTIQGQVAGESAFRDLINTPKVLAGADTTETVATGGTEEVSETTVPDTGSETLAGVILTLGALMFAAHMHLNGRKIAISKFEENTLEDL